MASVVTTARSPVDKATEDAERVAQRALQVAYRAALGVLGSREAAEDVAQEVAVKALAHAGRLR
jgi:DNA-directed RNA polymerase specialized sigma24 family protein